MHKERIEDFIRGNKEAFDFLEPNPELWSTVRNSIRKKESKNLVFFKVAASVLILSALSLAFYVNINETTAIASNLDPEFTRQEIQFIKTISEQKRILDELGIEQKNQDLLIEEEQLEREYLKLRDLYEENPSDDRVRESLIQNLRMRGLILMEQIELLKSINPSKEDDTATAI